jgi:acetylornithine deacetylase/succinyl-diaminopimelate desuccinylase-like protein
MGPAGADRDALLELAADELVRLVQIPSPSEQEHDAIRYLETRCGEWDLPVRRLPVDGAADDLVIGWSDEPSLLFTAHVDTVTPTWRWEAARDGDVVRGLGAGDCKGSVIAFLLGFVLARDAGVDLASLPVALGVCVDEELLGRGSIVMANALRPRFVVAGEPSRLDVGVAEAGFVDVRCEVHGTSAHGSFPERGDNAIEKAARLSLAMHGQDFVRTTHPLLGANLPGTLRFEGGGELHVIPDRARLRIEVRVVPGGPSAAEVEERVRAVASVHDADVELVEPSVEPFETPAASPVLGMLEAASSAEGSSPARIGVPAWTDAHNFVDIAGSEAVVWGPGDFDVAHDAEEAIDVREVVTAARVVARCLADVGRWS